MKLFTCSVVNCNSTRFTRQSIHEYLVDWAREGSVPGHPFITAKTDQRRRVLFHCAACGAPVPEDIAEEMEKEVA